ncbi:MAG: hypothetical protein C4297_04670 [Gemmataceae bacterium]
MSETQAANAQPPPGGLTEEQVLAALRPIHDPEIHLSIVDLGLIYGIAIENEGKKVTVRMTLTTPFCPVGPQFIESVRQAVRTLPGVEEAEVELVWSPPWDPRTHASDEVKFLLGIYD